MISIKSWKEKVKQLKTDTHTPYLACKDSRVPWYVKVFIAAIVAYVLCPIDLIPDFIPVLGYLDDLIIISAGFSLSLKMIPKEVLEECREKAKSEPISSRSKWIVAFIIVLIWLLVAYLILKIILQILL